MANEDNGVIQFTCEHCEISLTVDDFLAGVSAPCPSCGKSTKAPERKIKEGPLDVFSDVGQRREKVRPRVDQNAGQYRAWGSDCPRKRSRLPVSETQREREEVALVTRLLAVGVIVLAVVLAAGYYVYQAFNS